MRSNYMNNKIILIGGASGTAKTSTSKDISYKLDIAHRLGSGFVREMAKNFITKEMCPSLYQYSFTPIENFSPFENLYSQSYAIEPMIKLAVVRAFNEGTSIIIEGVNIIPGLNEYKEITSKVVLIIENEELHYNMIHGETHRNRFVSKENFKNVRLIQKEFINRAKDYGWNIFDISSGKNLEEILIY